MFVLFWIDHVIFLKVVVIVNVFMYYWRWHSFLKFGECYVFKRKCKHTEHSFIYWWLLRLEAVFEIIFIVLKLHAYHDTFSNGNIVRKRMNNFSHNAENITLCNTGWEDDTVVDFQYGFGQKFHRCIRESSKAKLVLYLKRSGMQLHLTWM